MSSVNHREFLENSVGGAYRTTKDGTFLYANRALASLLGFGTVTDLQQSNARFLYQDEADRERWIEDIEKSQDLTITRDARWRRINGQPIQVLESARAIKEDGRIIAYEGLVIDMSRLLLPMESTDETLAHQSGSYRHAQDSIDVVLDRLPVCVTRKDRNRKVVWANKMFCELEGISREVLLNEKNSDAKLYGSQFDAEYGRGDDVVFNTQKPHTCVEPHRFGDGSVRDVEVVKIPLFSHNRNTVVGVEVYFWDNVTLSAPLREFVRSTRIHELFRSTETALFEHDLRGNYQYLSPSAIELLRHRRTDSKPLTMSEVVAPEYVELVNSYVQEMLDSTDPSAASKTYYTELVDSAQRRIPVEVNSRLQLRHGKPSGVIGYIRDLTSERRRLSEVHHRVKNNLHTINALLARELREDLDSNAANVLRDCRSRISAIADLHEYMYSTSRVDHIEASQYIPAFVRKLVATYSQPWQVIDARLSIRPKLFLSLDVMIPCTLILQELISNTMKHAFPKKERITHGAIMVSLNTTERIGEYRLEVADTGAGLPPALWTADSGSLGMSLIEGLVLKQLKGRLHTPKSPKGAYFVIEFKDPSHRKG